nr:translation initiation factor IF-2 N-terminal domain-containing protein [Kaistella sp.]
MPKIRLNKAVKEFNISMTRLVEFLQAKGFEVESNPNAQLEESAYSALEAEFAKDGEQRKASHEVVMIKVPEEKLEIEPSKPEVIRAKTSLRPETKILGKIDLDPKKPEVPAAKEPEPEVKEEPVVAPTPATPEKQEFKVLDKIDLSQIEGNKPKSSKKDQPVKEEQKPAEKAPAAPEAKVETPAPAPEKAPEAAPASEEEKSDKIETVYQKLEGVKILKQTVDLSQFNKPKPQGGANSAAAKKKRKRIEKPNTPGTGTQGQAGTQQGNRPPGQGGNRPGQGGNRPGYQGGGNAGKGGSRRGAPTMPVELTDEQVKNQIKETLEKLTNKGGKNKGAKYRKEKRVYRREQDELQQEMDAADRTLKVTEFITVGELASLMNVSPTEVISACFSLGVMVTMNQRLEADTLLLVADEFGYKIEFSDADLEESAVEEDTDTEADLLPRAPIVT